MVISIEQDLSVIHLQEMPAYKDGVEEAEREGILIRYLVAPIRIIPEKGREAEVECIKMRVGKPDASGRRSPIPIRGSNFFVEADQVIRDQTGSG
jgi:NADPH-dependent glutamate synthase beta subunit-like oxidoreductase